MRDAFRYSLVAAVAFFASFATAADVTKRIDVAPGPVELRIDKPASSDYLIRWDARQPLDIQSLGPYESRTVMVVNAQPSGAQLVIDAEVIDWVAKLPTTTRFIINVGGTPPPPDVTPPDVKPDPKPDDPPKPPDQVAPIPSLAGLKVLLIYETSDLPPKVPKDQYNIRVDPDVTGWLTANTTPENGWVGWRVGDPDSGVAQGAMHWEKMLSLPRTSLPWIVINDGTNNRGYSGPLPENSAKTLELLKRFK